MLKPNQAQQTLGSCTLELAYEQSCRETQSIFAAEEIRKRRLQQLLLEHERDQLRFELTGCNDQVKQLEVQTREMQQAIADASSSLESAQADLKMKHREIETLKVINVLPFTLGCLLNRITGAIKLSTRPHN